MELDNPNELLDIFDENIELVGTKSRAQVHRDGDWHRTFHCWVVSQTADGQLYLIVQKRGTHKDLYPNLYDVSAAGHYLSGESKDQGIREINEELGIKVTMPDLVSLGVRIDVSKIGTLINREFNDVFLLNRTPNLLNYDFNTTELSGLAALNVNDGLAMYSGLCSQVDAQAVFIGLDGKKSEKQVILRPQDFVPHIDAYIYKILILTKRYFNGEKHLVI